VLVLVDKGQLSYFRRKARQSRNEIMALLVGKQESSNLILVYRFEYPELVVSTPIEVKSDTQSTSDIEQRAKDEGLSVVGSIHSHPNAPIYMSQQDLRSHRVHRDKISGICEVTPKRTFIAFWQDKNPVPCDWDYF